MLLDLLVRNGLQTLSGESQFVSVNAKKIKLDTINKIPFNTIYVKNQSKKIKGTKIFDAVQVKSLTTTTLNKVKRKAQNNFIPF